jgi:Asp-tRNA(Asn)/Glu-tRNA(Gln) amidotransferase A subunit family amidase
MAETASEHSYDRRSFMAYFASVGLGSTLLPGVLWAQLQQQQPSPITPEMVADAEKISGLSFTEEQRAAIAQGLGSLHSAAAQLHKEPLDMSVFPAIIFDPVPPGEKLPPKSKAPMQRGRVAVMARPTSIEELAYAPVSRLSELVRTRKAKPSELTEMYLRRLRKYDPQLHFVITLTEERARAQARDLDSEIARGKYRGPLHGIPWGAKDLLAVKGYPTTWGALPYKTQSFDYDATVVKRLDEAGAILVAKLTLGALAQGDIWFGERTRNPWNPATGSSGSSAGPASAVAAGCVGFAIGSETNGSITSPSRTCGVSGFRPTFGRVPRTGAMALSWTTDKLGPICRSAEDTALVFAAIQGPDGFDYSVKEYPFNWNANLKASQLRMGYFRMRGNRNLFERRDSTGAAVPDAEANNFIKVLESLGAKPVEVEDPTPDAGYLDDFILRAESGAAFQQATLKSELDVMMRGRTDFPSTWPDYFRQAQFYSAADYVNANRARTLLCQKWWNLFQKYDVIFCPQENTSVTNVVGTPSIVVPTGFAIPQNFGRGGFGGPGGGGRGGRGGRGGDSTRATPAAPAAPPAPVVPLPTGMYIMGPIFQDEKILAVAHAFQQATDFQSKHPPQFP